MSSDPICPGSPARTPAASRFPVEPAQQAPSQRGIPADLLFRGRQEILIDHSGEIYRLRITRNGKLILTK